MEQERTNEEKQADRMVRIKEYLRENAASLERLNLKTKLIVEYPRGKKVPFLGRLGIWLTNLSGGTLNMEFRDREPQ